MNVRMLETEVAMLVALAEREGVSQSEWVRNMVRREYALMTAKPRRKPKR